MFEVHFIRADLLPKEIYCYSSEIAASEHYELFLDDKSDLYLAVQLYEDDALLKQHIIGYSGEEIALLRQIGTRDQFDTCLRLYYLGATSGYVLSVDLIALRLKIANINCDRYLAFYELISK